MRFLPFFSRALIVCSVLVCGSVQAGPYADKAKPREERPQLDQSIDLLGPDANANGIRDDVEAWLDKTYTEADERAVMRRAAAALQSTLSVQLNDVVAVRAVADVNARAVQCLWGFPESPRLALPLRALGELEIVTMNTPRRLAMYQVFAQLIAGGLPRVPLACEPEG